MIARILQNIVLGSLMIAVLSFSENIHADEAREKAREGVEAYARQDYEGAVKAFRRAVELKPDDSTYQFNLGTALARRDQYNESEAALRKSSELESKVTSDAAYNLAYSLAQSVSAESETPIEPEAKLKKLREAVDGFRSAVIANPKDRDAKYNLETSRLMLRELEKQLQQQQQQQEGDEGEDKEGENQDQKNGDQGQQGSDQGNEGEQEQNQDQSGEQQGEQQNSESGQEEKEDPQSSEGQQEGLENQSNPKQQEGEQKEGSKDKQEGKEQKEGVNQQQQGQQPQQGQQGEPTEGQPQEGQPTEEQLDALRVLNSLAEARPEQFKKLFQFKGQRQRREKDW